MALQIATFKTRTISAAIFVVVMLTGLLWNQWSFLVLFSIIHFGCWFEYQKLVALIDPGYKEITAFHKNGVVIAGWCLMLYLSGNAKQNDYQVGQLSLHAVGWWMGLIFLFVLPIVEILFARQLNLKNISHSLFGLIYISLSLSLLVYIRNSFDSAIFRDYIGKLVVMMIIASIWINDTMAYIVGSLIGKTPFSKISPKKTWEGTAGGVILAIIVMACIGYWGFQVHDWENLLNWMIVAAIAGVAGTAGDLLESKLKRMAGVKDSGMLMPGHGGFLDRFDSLLVAIPFEWLFIYFFINS